MKAILLDMCILSHKTQCFLMFGHVVDDGAGKRRGLPVMLQHVFFFKKGSQVGQVGPSRTSFMDSAAQTFMAMGAIRAAVAV
jgi:hypothetical protein